MPDRILPAPPLGSRRTRIKAWAKKLWNKEPIGLVALIVTVLTIAFPLAQSCYQRLVGPDIQVIISSQAQPKSNTQNEIVVQVENYSDIPAQGLLLVFRSSNERLAILQRTHLLIGTIPPRSISPGQALSFISQESGTLSLEIAFKKTTTESNVTERTRTYDLTIVAE
jgi:hypothetical protein